MRKLMINVNRLFVRTNPSMKSEPVHIVNHGNIFEILGEEGNFYKIEHGWVVKLYVKLLDENNTTRKRGRREV